ncbi:MAG: hypothetical protein C4317_08460, partial [Acidimicrobiia bacterium]
DAYLRRARTPATIPPVKTPSKFAEIRDAVRNDERVLGPVKATIPGDISERKVGDDDVATKPTGSAVGVEVSVEAGRANVAIPPGRSVPAANRP